MKLLRHFRRLLAVSCLPLLVASAWAGVTSKPFGAMPDGRAVILYTLKVPSGIQLDVMNYGATVVRLLVPDASDHQADVVLGFDRFEDYLGKNPYFGSVIGRYANRIRGGRFSLDGKPYQLTLNDTAHQEKHHLHGGVSGFDKKLWQGAVLSQSPPSVRFQRISPDGEEGYPGNLTATVTYTLLQHALKIEFTAQTDQPTIYNPTSHLYLNLSGQGLVDQHRLTVPAEFYVETDKDWIPTGKLKPVAGTKLDFTQPTVLADRLYDEHPPRYVDHTFVLAPMADNDLVLAAELFDPSSGRRLKIFTDQPGLHCYPANSLDGTITGKGGTTYPQFSAICLEPQNFADAPNHPTFPSAVLRPGETFRSQIVYEFSNQ